MLNQLIYEKEDLKKQLYWSSHRIITNEKHRHELTVWRKINKYEIAFESLLLLQRVIDLEEQLEVAALGMSIQSRRIKRLVGESNKLVLIDIKLLSKHEERYTKLKKERDVAYGNYRRRFEKS